MAENSWGRNQPPLPHMKTASVLLIMSYLATDVKCFVRCLRTGEALPSIPTPDESLLGFESLPLNNDWIWLLESSDAEPLGLCICGHAHGLLLIFRLVLDANAPKSGLVLLFRRVLKDAHDRGCLGYLTFLEDKSEAEVKLMRIADRAGAKFMPAHGCFVAGKVDIPY